MRNLFALLIAIDKYDRPESIRDLSGSVNDLEGMEFSLDSYCRKNRELTLHKKVLKNKKATRQAIIDGFKFFDSAIDEDVCLFYFSGHGAQIDAPKEFGYEPDEQLEALVCHGDKGNDSLLIDKELSYLIAKAQQSKDVHFVVITDSCHSGSNTKDGTFTVRSAPPNIDTRAVDAYWGRSEYQEIKNAAGEIIGLRAPIGKHFKLGACASSELAKEKVLGDDGKTRGVFTYALLQVLKENGSKLSYATLVTKAKIKTQALVRDQSPQIETIALAPQECNRVYLNGLLEGEKPTFQVSYQQEQGRWVINAGRTYGVQEGDIVILEDSTKAQIKRVYVTQSLLDSGSLGLVDRDRIFDASIKARAKRRLNLTFAPGSDEDAKRVLVALLEETQPSTIGFDANKGVDYVVHAVDSILALTHPEGKTPVFSRIPGQGRAEARLFLKIIDQIAEWHHIIAIANPASTIGEDEIGIQLSSVENPHRHSNPDLAPAKPIADWHGENVFRYTFDDTIPGDPWRPPAFRLSIASRSGRKFWVSALYCGSGYIFDRTHYTSTSFSINNRFLEREELAEQGQVARMTDEVSDPTTDRHVAFESIQLSLLDDYYDQGYNEIKDLIKIFVSTEELDTTPFNMLGIPIDTQRSLAARHLGMEEEEPDWRTFEIPVAIVKPRDQGLLRAGQDKSFHGLTIAGHPTFSARVILSTVEEFVRSTGTLAPGDDADWRQGDGSISRHPCMPRPEIAYGNENVRTITLTDGLGDIEGCSVIEFYRSAGVESIAETRPLLFRIDPNTIAVEETHKVVLVGYSATARQYYALGTMDQQHEIRVAFLPPESRSLVDGLGGSIKMVLLSVRSDFELMTPILHGKDQEVV
jgi:hypothetical protein